MAATVLALCDSSLIHGFRKENPFCPGLVFGVKQTIQDQSASRRIRSLSRYQARKSPHRFCVVAATEGSAESRKSEETIPSWAKPDSDEPPPWAREENKDNTSTESLQLPFIVYLLASAVTAIAAIGSAFEYVNQNPIFGLLNPDSVLYAPILGFFAFTGIPTSAFLWYKSVQAANKEAEEQDRKDGYM